MRAKHLSVAGGLLLAASIAPRAAPADLPAEVTFGNYAPLARNSEIVGRVLSPLTSARLRQGLTQSGQAMREQAVNLAAEKFLLFVPSEAPVTGYALLVFVPPWQDARLPPTWIRSLERFGVIFVSAARSGNEENSLDRRIPLALHAAYNVMQTYPIDPERVYVGGFSGGSRVALRLALAFPDLFKGALLDAGSDPIGNDDLPLPQQPLWSQFQSTTRLVLVSGENDEVNRLKDEEATQSLRQWCIFTATTQIMPRAGHQPLDFQAMAHAMEALLIPPATDPDQLESCRAGLAAELDRQFQTLDRLQGQGASDQARTLLIKIDQKFGGLAAPRSTERWSRQ